MEAVGCLLLAAQISNPDFCFAVNMLSRISQNPGKVHLNGVERVMRYLQALLIKLCKSSEIIGFRDANWASDSNSKRSLTAEFVLSCSTSRIHWVEPIPKGIGG